MWIPVHGRRLINVWACFAIPHFEARTAPPNINPGAILMAVKSCTNNTTPTPTLTKFRSRKWEFRYGLDVDFALSACSAGQGCAALHLLPHQVEASRRWIWTPRMAMPEITASRSWRIIEAGIKSTVQQENAPGRRNPCANLFSSVPKRLP